MGTDGDLAGGEVVSPLGHAGDVRALLCRHCGGTVEAPSVGGLTTCQYCETQQIAGRRETELLSLPPSTATTQIDPSAPPEQREAARLAALHEQLAAYDAASNPYAYANVPEACAYLLELSYDDPMLPPVMLQGFLGAVERCEAGGGRPEDQQAVYWTSSRLENLMIQRFDPLRARAVVETAMDAVSEPGFKYLLVCSLANQARVAGDHPATEAWLALCDPAPTNIDLDSERRASYGKLRLDQQRFREVLAIAGEHHDDIPHVPSMTAVFVGLRVASFEGLGRPAEADRELTSLLTMTSRDDQQAVRQIFKNNPQWSPCIKVWSRLKERGPLPHTQEDRF